jgi:hypothetical protein
VSECDREASEGEVMTLIRAEAPQENKIGLIKNQLYIKQCCLSFTSTCYSHFRPFAPETFCKITAAEMRFVQNGTTNEVKK